MILLTGARQTGKTSLLRHELPDTHYVTLDYLINAEEAENNPSVFLSQFSEHVILDEIQYAPSLFRELKILVDENDSLTCALFERISNQFVSYLCNSSDNGESWERVGTIAEKHCESTILKLKNGEYLAAGRFVDLSGEFGGIGTNLFKSIENGTKWEKTAQISLPMQIPGDLARLRDGTILLTYGSRISGIYGVIMRISKDDGATWSLPRQLITIPERSDCGYPSSVQVEDGTIVTAYYFGPKTTPICLPHGAPWNKNYHMGVVRWRMKDDLFEDHESPVIEY